MYMNALVNIEVNFEVNFEVDGELNHTAERALGQSWRRQRVAK
jgi:hypothetical protein